MTTVAIPTTPDGLEEILNDDQRRAQVFADPETTKDFLANYAKATNKTGQLTEQITEQVTANLAEMLKANGIEGRPNQVDLATDPRSGIPSPVIGGNGAARNAAYNPRSITAQLDGYYESIGDLVHEIHNYRAAGRSLKNPKAFDKLMEVTNAYSADDPSAGGFLVPEEMRSQLLSRALERSVVRSRATVITMGSGTTSIPSVDETTHSGSVFGGMVFYWVGESSTITSTEAKFQKIRMEAAKLVGGARIPNELFNDGPALATWLDVAAPMGIAFYEDTAFITGDGANKPLGIVNAPAKAQVTRATNDELNPADVYGMFARMLPGSHGSAVWLINQTLLPQLFALSQLVGSTGGQPVFTIDITQGPTMMLLGRPVIITEKLPALANGSGDDIMFVDFMYYLLGDRQRVSLDYSEHSRFMNDESELRIVERLDGRPWVTSALTPAQGSTTLTPIVGLAD